MAWKSGGPSRPVAVLVAAVLVMTALAACDDSGGDPAPSSHTSVGTSGTALSGSPSVSSVPFVPTTPTATTAATDVPPASTAPTGDLPGWKQVFRDDFTRSSLGEDWVAYDGSPGSPGGWWAPSHVQLSGGMLDLVSYRDPAACKGCPSSDLFVSAGVQLRKSFTYGRFSVRLRLARAHGIPFTAVLWPADNHRPPEIDAVEGSGDYPHAKAYVRSTTNRPSIHDAVVDLTQWHTYTVEWRPGSVQVYVDGRSFGKATGSDIPDSPLRLALQSRAWSCSGDPIWTCPDPTTPARSSVQIDWVVVYQAAK